ncbi:MAG: N-acetylglucosamine-6-phosphate deacetylase [Clostridiales bacterium]|nr:N-acetylglucosamine-6-phosphate deacetylase [Clostridiales bacterium]
MLIKNGLLFGPDGRFSVRDIAFGETVTAVGHLDGPETLDAAGKYVLPGFLDIHTHGAVGEDASDGSAEGLARLSRYYASQGVTSWCPTTMTLPVPDLERALRAVRTFQDTPAPGARCLGVHLEGPFLSPGKRGAHAAGYLLPPDWELFQHLKEVSGGQIRLVTVAGETPGAISFIKKAAQVCTMALGHTAANYNQAVAAYAAGATHTTHLFNAMSPLGHREPGTVGAAFASGATVELICDGLHIHPAVVRMVFRLFEGRVALVSDSLRCAGMPDGEYTLGGEPIILRHGRATRPDGTLAGSSISVLDAVRNAISFGVPLEAAVGAATMTPAQIVGAADRLGSLEVGKLADLVILDRDLNLEAVYIGGKRFR